MMRTGCRWLSLLSSPDLTRVRERERERYQAICAAPPVAPISPRTAGLANQPENRDEMATVYGMHKTMTRRGRPFVSSDVALHIRPRVSRPHTVGSPRKSADHRSHLKFFGVV
jgi:hypothetical protein